MTDIVKLYLRLVDNPYAAKHYSDIAKYYKNKEMYDEFTAFEELLNERFREENTNTDCNAQQSGNT
jgi:hypothetical protein